MRKRKRAEVILCQPFIRQVILNFGVGLQNFVMRPVSKPVQGGAYDRLPDFQQEILRRKDHWKNRLRRLLGIPNLRFLVRKRGDILFLYGCFAFSRIPYCVYIENGLAPYNYDLNIARHPLARFLVRFLASRATCHQLIFMSQAAYRNFYASVCYPKKVEALMKKKSRVIYPIPVLEPELIPKTVVGALKVLFPGQYYIKGGFEIQNAFRTLSNKRSGAIELTVVTPIHMMDDKDVVTLRNLPHVHLVDARLDAKSMHELYRTHHVLLLPTYREGFGMVILEGLAFGMPIVASDQFAIPEMVIDGYNGFLFPNPLKDYDPQTYRSLGKFYNPADFYKTLFARQSTGAMGSVEDFIVRSFETFLDTPGLVSTFSENSISLFRKKFHPKDLSAQMEAVFSAAIQRR